MICAECNSEFSGEWRFCGHCGAKFEVKEVPKSENTTENLTDLDYMLMALRFQGMNKLWSALKCLPKMKSGKVNSSYEKLKGLGYIENDKRDGWQQRNFDPRFNLTEKGTQVLEKRKKVLESIWEKIKNLADTKDKTQFRKECEKNVSMFPLFMVMGFVNGAMLGTMMGSMGMNSGMYMQDMDMAYNEGYADGSGDFGGEGGDFGGEGGGFMDGGMGVGM